MTIKRSYLKIAALVLLCCAVAFFSIGPLLPRLLDINSYHQQIVDQLEGSLKRKISLGEIRFVWRLGPKFILTDLHLRERDTPDEFLTARKVSFRLRILPLLQRQVALHSIVIEGLQARLIRNADGVLNIADLLETQAGSVDLKIQGIKLREGSVTWLDHAAPGGTQQLQLTNLKLSLGQLARGKKCSFQLQANMPARTGNGTLAAEGSLTIPAAGPFLSRALKVKGDLELQKLSHAAIWTYFGDKIPFKHPGGTLDLTVAIKGSPEKFTASGMLGLENNRVIWPTVFPEPLAPKRAQLKFELERTLSTVDFTKLQLQADGFAFRGSLKLSDLHTDDPYLSAKGVSDPFDYQQVRSYIPFGIIDDDAAEFIRYKIRAGRFKLVNGSLAGRFSKLARFDEGDNPGALLINGTTEQAVIQYAPGMPQFSDIKGRLEMKGRDFNLHQMTARFGGTPMSLQGSITDYCTVGVPSRYPFQAEFTAKGPEVAWLAGLVGLDQLRFNNSSTLHLTGDGPVTAYQLRGEWQLQQASYAYPGLINKPAGTANSLNFSSVINNRETRLTALSFSLDPLHLSGLATFRYATATPQLAFELQTNSFNLTPQLPILNDWQQYQPKGTVQAHLTGKGDPRDFSAMLYNGSIRLAGFSIRPAAAYAPVNAINGVITFKGNSLETSRIAVRYGKTALELRGRIASLKNPEAEVFISSPTLYLSDFDIKSAEVPTIKQFSTHLGLGKDIYTIRNISGRLPQTAFSASGTIRHDPHPDVNLRMAVTHLDIDELLPLLAPQQPSAPSNASKASPEEIKPFRLHGQLSAETGSYGGLTFKKLKADFLNDGGLLQLQDFEAGIFGGKLNATGQLERVMGQPSSWSLNVALDRIKSDDLLHSLGINRETSGLMSVKGNLRGQGDSLDELKRTASGTLSLKIERGVLRRFSSLAKVFSLLNVSQLLTFQLPDMVREGMPFNQITTTVGLKDGILSTRDFFIESNAIHLSMVGKINIIKEDLDLLIGVQPLQTVDKVISRIPVVGWILTGGDGSLITTYFEAKGSWADPQVTAIPVKTIASGTLDIFRRVFELPVRLFTDTGEVVLGNQKERPKAKEE